MTKGDASFICQLLNDPAFLQYIGDKGVRSEADAVAYITNGPLASYARFGFGLYIVELRDAARPIGISGVLKRDALPDPDLGFAFLPEYRSQGYAFEAGQAVLEYARDVFGLERILAIVSSENTRSMALLARLGFTFDRRTRMPGDTSDVGLFVFGGDKPHATTTARRSFSGTA
jgi:ribosomal-protein-alanine N-acetyltransferase